MIEQQIFHIYEKETNEVVKHSLTVDELEQLIRENKVEWSQWDIQPCYTEYSVEDASF